MSRQKQKGTRWESAIRDHLTDEGIPVQRQPAHGVNDKGDLHAAGMVCIEAKNQARHSFAEWLDEATTEAGNAGLPLGVCSLGQCKGQPASSINEPGVGNAPLKEDQA